MSCKSNYMFSIIKFCICSYVLYVTMVLLHYWTVCNWRTTSAVRLLLLLLLLLGKNKPPTAMTMYCATIYGYS